MARWTVVGAGLSGAVFARELAESGNRVEVIEARNYVSGNCYDPEISGIRVHQHGPHFFHTNSEKIWNYVNKFSEWREYEHKVKGIVDGIEVPIPINLRSLELLFPQKSPEYIRVIREITGNSHEISITRLMESNSPGAQEIGNYIFDKVFLGYSTKQWGLNPFELNPSVLSRVPVRSNFDDRYFTDKYQALPNPGYTELVSNLLDHRMIKVWKNEKFHFRDLVELGEQKVAYTGALDELMEFKYGKLPYRSLHFEYVHLIGIPHYFSAVQTNFPNNQDFTRITDYGKILGQGQNTILAYEYPREFTVDNNERYYPIPLEENTELHNKYKTEIQQAFPNLVTLGRLADYKYYNMDQAIAHSLQMSKLYS